MAVTGGPRKGSRFHRMDDIPKDSFTPRAYQIELLESALKQNTILCLSCAQSKVFLSLTVAKQMSSVTRLSLENGGKRTFYLTDTDVEMEAIYQTLPHHTDLTIGKFSSTQESNQFSVYESHSQFTSWKEFMEYCSIVMCKGSCFLSLLLAGTVQLESANLLIFDDCHLCVDNDDHPYTNIVAHIVKNSQAHSDRPHILGVTASIAGTDCTDPKQLQNTIQSMEKSLSSSAETSMLILSERYGSRPKQSIIMCHALTEKQSLLYDILEEILLDNLDFLQACNIEIDDSVDNRNPLETPLTVITECLNILSVLGSWCVSAVADVFIMQIDKIIKCEKNDIHKKFLRSVNTSLRMLVKKFENSFTPDYDVDQLLEYTTSKVKELVNVLRNYKPEIDFMIINNNDSFDNDGDFSDMSDDEEEFLLSGGSDAEDESGGSSKSCSRPLHIAIKRTPDGGVERLTNYSEEDDKNLCGIVFVENHYIAFGLNKIIEEICSWDENLCFVKNCHIIGHNLKGTNMKSKKNKSYKKQEETLKKFRTQEKNLVITTHELEEGIDLPKCNLVVRFDPPKDYRSFTLSKGRARAREASFVILLDEGNSSFFQSNLQVFKGIEQVLLGNRKTETCDSLEIHPDENDQMCSLPPYSSGYAEIGMDGAITLINRYCAKLPSDAFTHLTPQCRIETVPGEQPVFIAHLRLPINSPIKQELKGPVMKSVKLAEKAVALKMCELLHRKGELDDNLVPVGKEMFLYEEEEEWADEEDAGGQARPGTTKRKQYYVKKVSDALAHNQVSEDEPCYLYLLNMRLTGRITDEQNTRGRSIYAPEDTRQTLGLVLSKRIPQMPSFPIYTRSGEVTASIDVLKTDATFTGEELTKLKSFHHFLFSGVLNLEKEPMEFAMEKAESGCMVVPLNGNVDLNIDWPFINKVIDFMKLEKRRNLGNAADQEPFTFSFEKFEDAVVMPSYRNIDQPQHFYVAEIRNDLNPRSPFPSPDLYKTFQDYYTMKYGLSITNTTQPLLDVDHTSIRLNLLTPRYMNQKGVALPTSSAETKKARRENLQQKQILIPELCDVHVIPASLWRKAVCLPAILYRLNCLLLSEELRKRISQETGIGIENLPEEFQFPKLDFGFETSPEKIKDSDSKNEEPKTDESSLEDCNGEKSETQDEEKENVESTEDALSLAQSNHQDAKTNRDNDATTKVDEDKISNHELLPALVCNGLVKDVHISPSSKPIQNGVHESEESISPHPVMNGLHEPISSHNYCNSKKRVNESSTSSNHLESNGICNVDNSIPQEKSKGATMYGQGVFTTSITTTSHSSTPMPTSPSSSSSPSITTSQSSCVPCTISCDQRKAAEVTVPNCSNCTNSTPASDQIFSPQFTPSSTAAAEVTSAICDPDNDNFNNLDKAIPSTKKNEPDVQNHVIHSSNGCDIENHQSTPISALNNSLQSKIPQDAKSDNNFNCCTDKKISNALQNKYNISKSLDQSYAESMRSLLQEKNNVCKDTVTSNEAKCNNVNYANGTASELGDASSFPHRLPSSNPAIVMNSLSNDLNDIHVDLILPVSEPSSAFQSDGFGWTQTAQSHDERIPTNEDVLGKKLPKEEYDKEISNPESNDENVIKFSFDASDPPPGSKKDLVIDQWNSKKDRISRKRESESTLSPGKKKESSPIDTRISESEQKSKNNSDSLFIIDVWKSESEKEKEKARDQGLNDKLMQNSTEVYHSSSVISLDEDRNLKTFAGPSPCLILQALTMSNANDFFSLERLETIGDSFLKYAITVYLYCSYPGIHEGKLSYLRSKQVSNYNLYRLGRRKGLAEYMVSTKFEPYENWLPPGFTINDERRRGPVPKVVLVPPLKSTTSPPSFSIDDSSESVRKDEAVQFTKELEWLQHSQEVDQKKDMEDPGITAVPFCLPCHHGLPDKSIADCVESLIGCYLTTCGRKAALMFMSWLGLKVLPKRILHGGGEPIAYKETKMISKSDWLLVSEQEFGELQCPPSPMFSSTPEVKAQLNKLLEGFEDLEEKICYKFKDRSYLLQAFTHASYHYNTITDCYQRVEFLGDAILDYVITRHLYEDSQKYSPGILTDLRSALVNNNIFAALAVKWGFHCYFKAISPSLFAVIDKFVTTQKEKNCDDIDVDEEYKELNLEEVAPEDTNEEEEDKEEQVEMEIPKALGDIFESVAGAIYLDSGMSLDTVWRVYYRMMKPYIDKYLKSIPKSPVRELLEREPETAKFERPERTMNGKVRVTVNVVGKGVFSGVGRNYRIAKSAAAKKALCSLRSTASA